MNGNAGGHRSLLFALAVLLLLGGCTVRYEDHSTYDPSAPTQWKVWPAPRNGDFLCMVVPNGTPVYAHPYGGRPILGYTRTLVAFSGIQEGRWVSVQHYNGLLGWIDGTVLRPFQNVHPGKQCVVGRDLAQRPIFYVH